MSGALIYSANTVSHSFSELVALPRVGYDPPRIRVRVHIAAHKDFHAVRVSGFHWCYDIDA